jgi:hypothetical protein
MATNYKVVVGFRSSGKSGKMYPVGEIVPAKVAEGELKYYTGKGWLVPEGEYSAVDRARAKAQERAEEQKEKEKVKMRESGVGRVIAELEERLGKVETAQGVDVDLSKFMAEFGKLEERVVRIEEFLELGKGEPQEAKQEVKAKAVKPAKSKGKAVVPDEAEVKD